MYKTKTKLLSPHQVLKTAFAGILFVMLLAGIALHVFGIDLVSLLPNRPLCPFRTLTGLFCPGCGMTRAFLAIGQLRIATAITTNLFSIPLFLLMIGYLLLSNSKRLRIIRANQLTWVGLAGVFSILVFWAYRIVQLKG